MLFARAAVDRVVVMATVAVAAVIVVVVATVVAVPRAANFRKMSQQAGE